MKGDITYKILSEISDAVVDGADLIKVILESGYGASLGKLNAGVEKAKARRETQRVERENLRLARVKYANIIYKLKRDGLIYSSGQKMGITVSGRIKLALLKNRKVKELPTAIYEKGDSKNFTIVAFDIPERDRRKRAWLRRALRELGLEMIQYSVWAGKVKIPAQFIWDLGEIKILEYVDIFEITKTGTLSKLE
ncbi:MAG: CRISPR-associated endonuclease Cas2 [Candidatus Liptonbacteria bacterium]|nr:CRISPR-associated endonuclease Cas2 [Candidatus Liptonbacteria bacterium]